MNLSLLIYFREDSLEFWTQNANGQTIPFQHEGSHIMPLYFSIDDDVIHAGSFAKERCQKGDAAAFGSFYANAAQEEQSFTRFNKKEPFRNLLFFYLKESVLPAFAALHGNPGKSFEDFLRSGKLRLIFDYCLTEQQTEIITKGFLEVIGFSPACISSAGYWEIFRKLVARKYPAERQKPVVSLYAAFGDLCFCLISQESPYVMSRKVIPGRGADPKTDLICEIIAEKAIEKGGSMLSLENAKKEVMPQAAYFLSQIDTGLIEGDVQLSDTDKIHIQFLASVLSTRMDNRASLNLIQNELDAFRKANMLQDTPIFLTGGITNSDSYQQFFQSTYSYVHPEWTGYSLEFIQECFIIPLTKGVPHIGIDLGTTFSCMSYVDATGKAIVIKNSDGQTTTPSIIWFDGKMAYIGKKANDRKLQANAPIFEFVKRDMGEDGIKRYIINGFNYRACGLSALILRKLKNDAFLYFKKQGMLAADDTPRSLAIPAVITVPAYFGDQQRQETRLAGAAAGLNMVAIINEPTAAAITYGISLYQAQRLLVFDLGGGTLDVTILDVNDGDAKVVATDGIDQLGGKDWDRLTEEYLYSEFERQTGQMLPDDMCWDIQKMALEAKIALSDQPETTVSISAAGETVDITLYRERPAITGNGPVNDDEHVFYFEERAAKLLKQCRDKLSATLAKAGIQWHQITEIVLAGGSSRMPMIPKLIESMAGRPVKQNIPGYSLDTAISQGAALYGINRDKVTDVCAKSIGIEVLRNGETAIAHLIYKNTPLPASTSRTFPAEANAELIVYEGEGDHPTTCRERGQLQLKNPAGKVTVSMSIDINGVIHAAVTAKDVNASLLIKSGNGDVDAAVLQEKIDGIDIR